MQEKMRPHSPLTTELLLGDKIAQITKADLPHLSYTWKGAIDVEAGDYLIQEPEM